MLWMTLELHLNNVQLCTFHNSYDKHCFLRKSKFIVSLKDDLHVCVCVGEENRMTRGDSGDFLRHHRSRPPPIALLRDLVTNREISEEEHVYGKTIVLGKLPR